MKKTRLSKYLAATGVASRRAAEELIFAGKVTVNGDVSLLPQTLVDSSDTITVLGKATPKLETKVYFMLNKPKGYVCTASDLVKRRVLDLFQQEEKRLFTVGRLDKDTMGLLLVTNDGHFANQVIHPSFNIHKEYLAKTTSEITQEHLERIARGGFIEGAFVKPVKVTKVRRGTVKVIVSEGKKREVRLLLEKANLEVIELTRIRIGGLSLGSLPLGQYRALTEKDKRAIFGSVHENA